MPEKELLGLITRMVLGEGEENSFGEKLFNPQTRGNTLDRLPLTQEEKIQVDEILEETDGVKDFIETCIERGLVKDWSKPNS